MKHINTIRRAMALVAVMVVTMATTIAQTAVKYIDKNGEEQTCPTTCTVVEENITAWNAGWYLVNGEVVISGGVTVTGEVHLILADGASLTVTGAAGKAGVNVSGDGNSLTIYGQAGGTGQLTANGMGYANGTGGGAGIGGNDMQSGGNITVNGGIVTANGGGGGAGIGGGADGTAYNIEINRGTVTANGSLLSTGIGEGRIQKMYLFTVAKNKTVEFSKGNLYWDGTAEEGKKWNFEANQWDYRTWAGKNSCINGNVSETGTPASNCGLFKWGNAADAIANTTTNPTSEFFAASDFTVDGQTGWSTLTNAEWNYLLSNRNNASSLCKLVTLTLSGEVTVYGLVILPDGADYETAFGVGEGAIKSVGDLATHGAVFLPTVGRREGTDVVHVGMVGNYWSSTPTDNKYYAYYMYFHWGGVNTGDNGRLYGYCVRLVREQKAPNTTATLTLSIGGNTVAEALGVAWNEDDVVKVYNGGEQVDTLNYRNHDGGTATFTGYINEGIEAGTQLTFRRGTTPAFTEQDGALATLQANYSLEGTAEYNAAGIYNNISMGVPYALMKLDLSAFGNAAGTTVTIKAGDPSATVASVTGVTTSSKELYLAMPANGVETEYTFCGNGEVVKKTWALEANKFYTKEGSSTGGAIVVGPPVFSVSATKTVEFSKGNLYYDGKDFKFEANQWSYANSWNSNHVSHFFWSKTASVAYAGMHDDPFAACNDAFFAATLEVEGDTWSTLANGEWNYLLGIGSSYRDNASSLRGWGTVAGVPGLVILPDGSTTSLSSITKAADLAAAGAVFLPAAGFRYETDMSRVGSHGYYWSSTPCEDDEILAYCMCFYPGYVGANSNGRYDGSAVRLVRELKAPNSIATITLSNGDNTAAKALEAAWKEGDVVNVYNGDEQVGELSYRYDEGDKAIFKGYINNENLTAGTPLTFRKGTTPSFTEQDGALATLETNYSLEGTAEYNASGNYNNISMGVPYALMKLDLSAFGTASPGTTVTIKVGSPSIEVASVAGVTTTSKELYVAMPAAASREYTFSGNSYYAYMTCTLAANTFYTKEGSTTGEAIVVKPDAVDLGLTGGLLWSVCNLGATNGSTKESWYGDYYAWGATETWYSASGQTSSPTWKDGYSDGYSWAHCPHTNGTYTKDNKKVFTKYVPQDKADTYGYNGYSDTFTVLEAADDAAHAVLGGDWRMPTTEEWEALYNNNTFEWVAADNTSKYVTSFKAVASGYLVIKGKGDGMDTSVYMFLPAAGYYDEGSFYGASSGGYYWLSTLYTSIPSSAYGLYLNSSRVSKYDYGRNTGRSVRPVCQLQD